MSAFDLHTFVLTPVDKAHSHTPDSTLTTADCGHQCWIAASTRQYVDSPLIRTATVCWDCVDPDEMAKDLAEQGGPFVVPGVREQANKRFGVAAVDQLWARWRVRENNPEAR